MVKAAETVKRVTAAPADNSFVAELEAANLHPLWDRFKKDHAGAAAAARRAADLALEGHRALCRAGGRRSRHRRRRTPRAHSRQSGLCRRDGDDLELDRGLHRARSRRPRASAPPHLRGHPLRNARRRRRDHRQRPALRDARGRSYPHSADVLARPYQRKQSPHRLVRRRQHPAYPLARCQFLRAGRSGQQCVLAGRRRRRAAMGGAGADRRQRAARRRAFAEIPLFRRSHPALAGGAAGRGRTARAPCATPTR